MAGTAKAKTERGHAKLTNTQRKQIVIKYYEEQKSMKDLAAEYGVTGPNISALVNSPKWIRFMEMRLADKESKIRLRQNLALMRAVEAAPNAMERMVELSNLELTPENMPYSYLVQNASRDILDRVGVKKAAEEESKEIRITFNGQAPFTPGMPKGDTAADAGDAEEEDD